MDIKNSRFSLDLEQMEAILKEDNLQLPEPQPYGNEGGLRIKFDDGSVVTLHEDTRPQWMNDNFFLNAEPPPTYICTKTFGYSGLINAGLLFDLHSERCICGVIYICNDEETHWRCIRPRERGIVTIINIYESNHIYKLCDD